MSFVNAARSRSLSRTLITWFVGAAMVIVILTVGLLYVAAERGLAWRDQQVLIKRMLTVRDQLLPQKVDPDTFDHEVSEDLEGPRQLFMRIIGPGSIGLHETPLMPSDLTPDRFPSVSDAPSGEPRFGEVDSGDGRKFRAISARVQVPSAGGAWATIQLAADTSLDEEVLNSYAQLILGAVAGALVLSCLIGWYVVRTQMKPVEALAEATGRIQYSNLDYRIALGDLPVELANFARQFNDMLARLEKAYQGLKRYADNVAHELRTPLNRIQLEAEVALRDGQTGDDYKHALEANLDETEHLSKMVRSLLFLARAESGQMSAAIAPVNVAERLEKIRAFFESSAIDAGVSLAASCPAGLTAMVDDTLFQRAISNLAANALSHTPKGGRVSIAATAESDGVCIEVADSGEGISPEHQPHVFDRFFRADMARTSDGDRVGLGLAITKSIVVDLHGGKIDLESELGHGTTFRLHFPSKVVAFTTT